jgi:calcium/proton exchanger cax
VRLWRLTTSATRGYRQQQTRALRSLLGEGQHDEALAALLPSTLAMMSEILVGSIEAASESIGLSTFFVGIIVVAVVGNAAEHWVSVYFAMRDKMDLSVNIAIGSSAQIALFIAPALVLLSFVLGPFPMALCSTASRWARSCSRSSSHTS